LTQVHTLATASDTWAFGTALATRLRPGDLVLLAGPLGAGKTVLAQGIGAGLGVVGPVTSPTFVIARVHRPDPARGGTVPLVHVDAYRLGTVADPRAEVDDLDLDTVTEDAVTVVEWGEGMVEQLAEAYLLVRIDRPDGGEGRVVELTGHGGDWARRLAGLLPAGR
jgi:tRNA threonylcarbamoyladenosine biosynthesis protein TsaE